MSEEQTKARQKLGRGLSALFGEERQDLAGLDGQRPERTVPIEALRSNPFQPRRRFDPEELQELADSIRAHGLLQPILVRRDPADGGGFQIVAGERRWRAAQLAQLHEIPVVVREISDSGALEVAIVENVQRQDLNPLEEAEGYRRLIDEFAHRQEDLGKLVGKSRSHIANTMRLLNLPSEVQKMLADGLLTAGHARALLNAANPIALAKEVIAQGLSVRQTEKLAQDEGKRAGPVAAPAKDADTAALERDLSETLGLKVSVSGRGEKGKLTIHYRSLDQLDEVLKRLKQNGRTVGAGLNPPLQ